MRYKLGDVVENFDSQRIPLSASERKKIQGQYPYYGAQGVIDYIDKYIFDGEYLLIAEDGENLKSRKQNIAQIVSGKFWVNNHAHILQSNGLSDLRYLCYVLNNTDISGYVTGSAQPKLSQSSLNAIELDLPDICTQRTIGAFLSTLDEKIENNSKTNHHIEQIAQAIFKSWFVDFEPFGGEMPSDWREGTLSDICTYSSDRVLVSSLSLDTYISTENMVADRGGYVTAKSLPTVSQTTGFTIGDTLISNIRPYFKKIVYCDFSGGCSTDVLCFRPIKDNLSLFVYYSLYSDDFFDYMVAGSKGTKMPRGDKQQIMNYRVVIPADSVVKKFTNLVLPMVKAKSNLNEESTRLATLRDTLLPRLMSGELSVADLKDIT